jgi:hypothetical protein
MNDEKPNVAGGGSDRDGVAALAILGLAILLILFVISRYI